MISISKNDRFTFACHPRVPCFNECCRNLNQFLYPYDILRLTRYLKIRSDAFLKRYTVCHTGPESGLPMVTLRPDPGPERLCPFVSGKGCRVYPHRPASCRIYPVARALSRNRATGAVREHFALVDEPHCHGHKNGKTWTVVQWMTNQGLDEYNRINDRMITLIHLKNQHHPGPLDPADARRFQMACYDLDTFRRQIFKKGLVDHRKLDTGTRERLAKDDLFLLQFGLDWIKREILSG